MIFVFGGKYQGKLDFVKDEFNIDECEIFFCDEENGTLDRSKKVIYGMEKFILASIREGKQEDEIVDDLNEYILGDKIIIAEDISQGIVPIDQEMRRWREIVGRIMVMCMKSAESGYRIFCGLPDKLK